MKCYVSGSHSQSLLLGFCWQERLNHIQNMCQFLPEYLLGQKGFNGVNVIPCDLLFFSLVEHLHIRHSVVANVRLTSISESLYSWAYGWHSSAAPFIQPLCQRLTGINLLSLCVHEVFWCLFCGGYSMMSERMVTQRSSHFVSSSIWSTTSLYPIFPSSLSSNLLFLDN